jgi:hypothetical protein
MALKPNEKKLADAPLGKKATASAKQNSAGLSKDVRDLLGVANANPAAAVATTPAPDAAPGPQPSQQTAPPLEAASPVALPAEKPTNSTGLDEFAQWEDQVNDQMAKRYRRSSDRYLGEERRFDNNQTDAEPAALPDFPDLSVVVYEPLAVVRGNIVELFENFSIPVTEPLSYDDFKIALEGSSIKETFTVAILGDENDVEINAMRVQELRAEHPEKPLVFLSTMDLSQLRRRILHAGASYFIQKPDMDSPNLGSLQIIKKRFLDDLLLFVSECHARYIAVYNALTDSK